MNEFDVVVIGGGAAGLSAALVLTRARRRVLVVDSAMPRNGPAARMQGFLSRDGLPPDELLAIGRSEVAAYGGEVVTDTVTGIVNGGASGFRVALRDDGSVAARRLLVATGLRDVIPEIPGLRERWARDVLHCPYCHGYEVKDQAIGVLGSSPETVRYAQIVRQWSDDVAYFVPAGTLTAEERLQISARSIGIVEGAVRQVLVDDDRLCGLELDDGRTVRRDALFVAPRFVPNGDLLIGLGCELDGDGRDHRRQRPDEHRRRLGRRQRRQPARPGDHCRRRRIRGCHRHQRRPGRRGRSYCPQSLRERRRDLVTECQQKRSTELTNHTTKPQPARVPPPSKHQLALMIWLCVFPT